MAGLVAQHAGKQQDLRKTALERNEVQQVTVDEQLKALATEFARWVNKKPGDVLDVEMVEVIDAVHAERKEGLQAGERTVQQSPGSDPQEGGTEQSTEDDAGRGESP